MTDERHLRVVGDTPNADPWFAPERVAERAAKAQAWVDYIKAGLRGEVDLLADPTPTTDQEF